MRRVLPALFLLVLSFHEAGAQNSDLRRAYEEFASDARDNHRAFVDSVNTAFIEALESNWEEFRLQDAELRGESPLPSVAPAVSSMGADRGTQIQVSEIVTPSPRILEAVRTDSRQSISDCSLRTVSFPFYGSSKSVRIPLSCGFFHPAGISEEAVGEFWSRLAEEDFSYLLALCRADRERFGYNDWAVSEWVGELARTVFSDDVCSEREIFRVFILNQLNLKVKLARSGGRLTSLFACCQKVFARKYTLVDTYAYYMADASVPADAIYTYRAEFNPSARPLDLRFAKPLELGRDRSLASRKSTVFSLDLSLPINDAKMRFYDGFPQTTPDVYALTAPSEDFLNALVPELETSLCGLGDADRVNEILRFIHYDFVYKVDDEQFGREKPFFVEENFFYGAGDCEDRAVLFSFLVRNLTGRRVLLLEWDDHVAAAVNLPDGSADGSFVKAGDGKYYVCDPSYVGARAGMCMPSYAKKPAKVYVL